MLNEPQPVADSQPAGGLPAFITGGVARPIQAEPVQQTLPEGGQQFDAEHDNAAFHLRNRRRRRPRGPGQEGAESGDDAGERPATDEVPAGG